MGDCIKMAEIPTQLMQDLKRLELKLKVYNLDSLI